MTDGQLPPGLYIQLQRFVPLVSFGLYGTALFDAEERASMPPQQHTLPMQAERVAFTLHAMLLPSWAWDGIQKMKVLLGSTHHTFSTFVPTSQDFSG